MLAYQSILLHQEGAQNPPVT